jgi:hypothetical protein
MKCANIITEHMIGSHRKKIESTGTALRLESSSNQPGYRNTSLSITLNRSKIDIAGRRGRRV